MLANERFIFVRYGHFWGEDIEIKFFVCQRESTDLPRVRESLDDMMLTHPPAADMRTFVFDRHTERFQSRWRTDFKVTGGPDKPLTLGQLLRFASPSWRDLEDTSKCVALNEEEPQVCNLPQLSTWRLLRDSIDTLTGYKMLEIYSMSHEGREDELESGEEGFGRWCESKGFYDDDEDDDIDWWPSGKDDPHDAVSNISMASGSNEAQGV